MTSPLNFSNEWGFLVKGYSITYGRQIKEKFKETFLVIKVRPLLDQASKGFALTLKYSSINYSAGVNFQYHETLIQ